MPFSTPHRLCLLLIAGILAACATPPVDGTPGLYGVAYMPVPPITETPGNWSAYPILAHKLHGEEAPIVRWIDTDGDGISNYRLLCTFANGRVRVDKAISDTSFIQRFEKVRG